MDERGGGRLAVGAGDADDLVRRKLGPGAGEQLDVADDLDAGLAGALRDRVAVERQAGRDDEAVELGEVGVSRSAIVSSSRGDRGGGPPKAVEGPRRRPLHHRLRSTVPLPSSHREEHSSRSSFASHAVTLAPLASSASTVASPDRARP